jgi:hypothetical protein
MIIHVAMYDKFEDSVYLKMFDKIYRRTSGALEFAEVSAKMLVENNIFDYPWEW